jgi:hypothetical protein
MKKHKLPALQCLDGTDDMGGSFSWHQPGSLPEDQINERIAPQESLCGELFTARSNSSLKKKRPG